MENVTCPFCGLACDDLQVDVSAGMPVPMVNACATGREAYRRLAAVPGLAARVDGTAVSLDVAVARAAQILGSATNPLFGGFATDLSGARRVVQLADRCGAVIDHMNSTAKLRNLLTVQDAGWITATLAEVKNRADLVVLLGTDAVSRFPRFFERVVWNAESMFDLDPRSRDIVYVGKGLDMRAGHAPDGRAPTSIPCRIDEIGEALGAMRSLLAGLPPQAQVIADVPLAQWTDLLERLRNSRYGVIVWAAPDFDFPHAELTVQTLSALIKDLNQTTRVCGVPLGGSDGDFTANGVLMWQTGLPIRSSFATGIPVYEPHLNSTQRLLDSGEADALLWVTAFNPNRVPPTTELPTIVLAPPGARFEREPDVFIAVGTPGVDHAGHYTRTDKVVALPLRKLRETGLPSVEVVVAAIEASLQDGVI
jgi:formylmethanofuran dehydrogenase subunit B